VPPPLPSVALRAPREGPALPRHGEPVSDPESEADRPAFGGCLPILILIRILILNVSAETCGW